MYIKHLYSTLENIFKYANVSVDSGNDKFGMA